MLALHLCSEREEETLENRRVNRHGYFFHSGSVTGTKAIAKREEMKAKQKRREDEDSITHET